MFKSNFFKSVLFLSLSGLLASCSKEDTPTVVELKTKTFSNLYAPQTDGAGAPSGAFTKFSFSQNATVTNNSWDIAFRGTTIIVNGGSAIGITDEPTRTGIGAVSIVSNSLEKVTTIPSASTFKQDATKTYSIPTGSGNGWYNYNSTTHIISPLAGKIFIVKTHDGKYAKMEILSYYKDAPANPALTSSSKYFTFKYVYQPSGTTF